jgi:hypothetical protein
MENSTNGGSGPRPDTDVVEDSGYKGRGGWRAGGGRPKGSKNIHSKESIRKLEALGFDPIEMMVDKYWELEALINRIISGPKPSMQAVAMLVNTQQKISNDLMSYGYNKVPDRPKDVEEEEKKQPVRLVLTDDVKSVTATTDSDGSTTVTVKSNPQEPQPL